MSICFVRVWRFSHEADIMPFGQPVYTRGIHRALASNTA